MSTPAAPSTPERSRRSKGTSERRVASLFGLKGDNWMRHANPWSVWTRFAVLPLLILAVWSRDWIGWWSLVPLVLSLVFMVVNPLLFPTPRSTRNWASKAVFGERIWADRNTVELPEQFRTSRVPAVAQTTVAGLLAGLPRIVGDLDRIDQARTALRRELDQACPTP
jgi:hypothetical protein